MKLYELTGNYLLLLEMLEDGDTPAEDLQDTLDSITELMEVKVENIVKMLNSMNAKVDMFKAEEGRLKAKRQTLENRCDSLKSYLENQLRISGKKSIDAGLFKVAFQKSPASVSVLDIEKVPQHFLIQQPRKVDTNRIKEILKSGVEIDGVKLITDKEHLRIK